MNSVSSDFTSPKCLRNDHDNCIVSCDCDCHIEKHLNREEIKLLYDFIKHQHISYGNIELIETVRKIARIIDEES